MRISPQDILDEVMDARPDWTEDQAAAWLADHFEGVKGVILQYVAEIVSDATGPPDDGAEATECPDCRGLGRIVLDAGGCTLPCGTCGGTGGVRTDNC